MQYPFPGHLKDGAQASARQPFAIQEQKGCVAFQPAAGLFRQQMEARALRVGAQQQPAAFSAVVDLQRQAMLVGLDDGLHATSGQRLIQLVGDRKEGDSVHLLHQHGGQRFGQVKSLPAGEIANLMAA